MPGVLDALNAALDRQYDKSAGAVLSALRQELRSPAVRNAMRALDAEAQRLAGLGQPLIPSNPVYRAMLGAVDAALRKAVAHAEAVTYALQLDAAALGNATTLQLAQLTAGQAITTVWNSPDPVALGRIADYAKSSAWQAQFGGIPRSVIDQIGRKALAGVASGRNPLAIAEDLRKLADNIPAHFFNTMMTTLQLTSYREAAAFAQLQNAHILSHQVRVAARDDRTCLACIALSGEILPLGVRVDDHHNGRCVGVPVVQGRELSVVTGQDWFNGLPTARQRSIMGVGNYNAYQQGAVTLNDFVGEYHDSVFGRMIRPLPLMQILGSNARQYYGR